MAHNIKLAIFTAVIAANAVTCDAGWLEKATGIKTPAPIRNIAPNGIRIPAPRETTSTLPAMDYVDHHEIRLESNNRAGVYYIRRYSGGRTTTTRVRDAHLEIDPRSGARYWADPRRQASSQSDARFHAFQAQPTTKIWIHRQTGHVVRSTVANGMLVNSQQIGIAQQQWINGRLYLVAPGAEPVQIQ